MWSKEHSEAGSGRRGVARPRKAAAALRRIGRRLVTTLFPGTPPCPACHRRRPRDGADLCPECSAKIPWTAPPLCRQCGRPLRPMTGGPGGRLLRGQDATCRRCAVEPRYFHAARAPAVYAGAMKDYIHRFKYGGERELGMALGVLLGRCLEREPVLWPVDALVPVPLHPSRLEDRGFNQAEVLARVVGEWVGRPVWADALRRVRKTETQTKLSARERHANVRGAFRPWRAARLAGRRLLLVDDVYTSGATVEEAARVLLKAGAAQVNVLCLAVGVRPAEWLEAG